MPPSPPARTLPKAPSGIEMSEKRWVGDGMPSLLEAKMLWR
jgi:hypothetical protein